VTVNQADNAYEQPVGNSAVPSAARTATGQSSALRVFGDKANFLVDVTAVSGTTPSMTLSVEWSHDGTTWFPAATPDTLGAAITAAVKRVHTVDIKGKFCRLVWTITGTTPSFTFAVHVHLLDY
jgi:hypothetical protein